MIKITQKIGLMTGLLPALTWAAPGIQEVLTPAQYFECQIAARQATVQGLQERVALHNKPGATDADKRVAGDVSRSRVTLALHNCGNQNAGMLGAYAHRNADVLQTWLGANPQVKARLDGLGQRVASLSAQMPAISPSAKR